MLAFIMKLVIGLGLGLLVSSAVGELVVFWILWGVGIAFAFRTHLRWLGGTMRWAMQLSVITYLSFGTGFLGFLLLLCVLVFNLTIGWLYGIYLLLRDIITLCRGGKL